MAILTIPESDTSAAADAKGWADLFAQIFGGAPTTKTESGSKTESGTKLESGQKTEGQMDIMSSAATEPLMQMLTQLIPGSTGGLANPQAQQLIAGLLTQFKEGAGGLSGIQAAGNAAGVYNSSTQGLLANDAMSRALAQAAGAVNTQQNQQQQVIANLLNSLRAGTQQQTRVTGTNTGTATQTAGQTNTGGTTTTQTGGLAQTPAGRAAAALGALGAATGALSGGSSRKPPAKPNPSPGTNQAKTPTPETAATGSPAGSGTSGENPEPGSDPFATGGQPPIGDQPGDYPQTGVSEQDPFGIGGYDYSNVDTGDFYGFPDNPGQDPFGIGGYDFSQQDLGGFISDESSVFELGGADEGDISGNFGGGLGDAGGENLTDFGWETGGGAGAGGGGLDEFAGFDFGGDY